MVNVNNRIRKRDVRIDIIKGVSILLVLWGHSIQSLAQSDSYYSDPIFKMIYSFHMPLFAFINGYLFYSSQLKRNFKEVLHSKISVLLIPIVIWTSVDWIIGILVHKEFSIVKWAGLFTGNMLWFLWGILAANLVLVIAEKKIKSRCIKIIWLFTGFFLMYIFPNAELNLYLYPYVIFGFYYRKHNRVLKKFKLPIWIYEVLFILLLFFYNEDTFIYTSGISLWNSDISVHKHILIDLYRYIIGFIGSDVVVYCVCKMIGKFRMLDNVISRLGCYTMQIYIIQCFFFKELGMILKKIAEKIPHIVLLKSIIYRDVVLSLILCLIVLGKK